MGKRNLTLYIDDDLISLASSRNINISRLFNEILSVELQFKELSDTTNKEELINKLKSKVAILSDEIKILTEKLELEKEETQKLKNELEEEKKKKKKGESEEGKFTRWKI